MIEIDGAQNSGSGTIVRYAVALASLLGQPLHLFNARAKREKPGLRPQHLTSVLACAEMCGAKTQGVNVGSHELTFIPGGRIKGGAFAWDIGTAGSTTMLALSILPLACFANSPVTARITGGVFQDFAPSPHHMQNVLAPLLQRMGLSLRLAVVRAGYVPKGAGVIELSVRPIERPLHALTLTEQGSLREVSGIAFSSHLRERRVSERMARVCEGHLANAGLSSKIERLYDTAALHAGASLVVWGESSTGCILGADRAGALRRSSEVIGRFVAEKFLADLTTGATVDQHIADQLVLFATLADGTSRYLVPRQTEHLASNLRLAEQFGAKVEVRGKEVTIEGVGFHR
ncbi:MAG: RNA 3'-phosphate cyclase [Deltaproteobacteria bacterium]|nr:RNA 3'-phosphate cyclase [Deltaproteobacteria bacterium]